MCVGSRGKVKAKSLTYKCALIHTYGLDTDMCVRVLVCFQYAGPAGVESVESVRDREREREPGGTHTCK